jgi:hypothetical protein
VLIFLQSVPFYFSSLSDHHLEYIYIDMKIILKWISSRALGCMLDLSEGPVIGYNENDNKPSEKSWEFRY